MSFLDIIFPKRCAGCGKMGTYLCNKCRVKQALHWEKICPVCEAKAIGGNTHVECMTEFVPDTKEVVRLPVLDGATFIFQYRPPVSVLLKQLKYRFGREILPVISRWTADELKKRKELPSRAVLVPIPLYPYRQNWRGFNQAEELGREAAKVMGWQFRNDILVRSKWRSPQTEVKSANKRLSNVQGIFSLASNILVSQYPSIILFDDVWTTGSTIKEATKVLKEAGAKKVWGLTIAR